MQKIENGVYKTSDMYLAAFLMYRGWFVRLEREEKLCFFTFMDDPGMQEDITDYFNNGEVGALRFKGLVRDLKTMVFNT